MELLRHPPASGTDAALLKLQLCPKSKRGFGIGIPPLQGISVRGLCGRHLNEVSAVAPIRDLSLTRWFMSHEYPIEGHHYLECDETHNNQFEAPTVACR
ncbi:hypothetical protein SAMN05444158_2974 [Bradyrhizobium canariense]|uniref:Uncharacterized protein n=1 Tax=Bradyrhizobium canariense TaxID=255045 RepID=A0A1H1UJ34_9BRAD|nr:hypothetical protein SAMN05444158_2974 [Bradyrhizobium canariense]